LAVSKSFLAYSPENRFFEPSSLAVKTYWGEVGRIRPAAEKGVSSAHLSRWRSQRSSC
jgi:hypothetical protein